MLPRILDLRCLLIAPSTRGKKFFDGLVLLAGVAMNRHQKESGIHQLPIFGDESRRGQLTFEQVENLANHIVVELCAIASDGRAIRHRTANVLAVKRVKARYSTKASLKRS